MPSPPGKTRDRMMDVAEILFHQRGYAGVTVEDVTDALGVKKPNLYNHFRDKSDLYVAVRLRRLSRVGSDMASATGGDQSFTERLEAVVATLLRHPYFLAALLYRDSEAFLPPQTRDLLFARAFGTVYEPVTRLLRAGAATGELPMDPDGIAFAYEALVALAAHFGASEPETRPPHIATLAARITRFLLSGVSVATLPEHTDGAILGSDEQGGTTCR